MTIDEIITLWNDDVNIDQTELSSESLKIPKLHNKYYQILINEKLLLKKLEIDFKKLKLEKYEFYTQGPNEETNKKGWELPAKGIILKSDIPLYMEADEDLCTIILKISYQQEKIECLESIIKSIMNRGYLIKNAIEWQKFTMGG
jgi:hypothetical protein